MADTIFKYPLDLEGTSADNKAVNEAHTIGSSKGRIFIADYGPFFGNSVTLTDAGTGKELEPGLDKDYVPVHYYREAADITGQAVYAGIRIVNPDVGTSILLTCQYVGGEFSFSTYALKQAIEALQNDERPVSWGDLVGVPSQFVPAPHLHSAYDLYGMKYVVEAYTDVASAIRDGDNASRELLKQQITAKLNTFDQFCTAVAQCFADGADELAAVVTD